MSAYIDKAGKTVIDASGYENAGPFSEGLAPVNVLRQGWGFIDKTGAMTIPPQFEIAAFFKDGLAPVLIDDKWGFIDRNGTLVIENQFDFVAEFSKGVAIVERSSKPKRPPLPPVVGSHITFIVETWKLADTSSEGDRPADSEGLALVSPCFTQIVPLAEEYFSRKGAKRQSTAVF